MKLVIDLFVGPLLFEIALEREVKQEAYKKAENVPAKAVSLAAVQSQDPRSVRAHLSCADAYDHAAPMPSAKALPG